MPREAAFRVHVGELIRHPGVPRPHRIAVAVDWAIEMSRIEPDPPLTADFELVATSGGVVVRGVVSATATHTCVRCLNEYSAPLTIEVAQLVETRRQGDEEDAEYLLEGEELDLEPILRDELLLAMPLLPSCGDDCPAPDRAPELVQGQESDLNEISPGEAGRPESPFAVLQDLFEPGE